MSELFADASASASTPRRGGRVPTLGGQFKDSLHELYETLMATDPHFVRSFASLLRTKASVIKILCYTYFLPVGIADQVRQAQCQDAAAHSIHPLQWVAEPCDLHIGACKKTHWGCAVLASLDANFTRSMHSKQVAP